MKVRVLIKTVISGHWLSVGDVYEGTEEELRLYLRRADRRSESS